MDEKKDFDICKFVEELQNDREWNDDVPSSSPTTVTAATQKAVCTGYTGENQVHWGVILLGMYAVLVTLILGWEKRVPDYPQFKVPEILKKKKVAEGKLGRKSEEGWYKYNTTWQA